MFKKLLFNKRMLFFIKNLMRIFKVSKVFNINVFKRDNNIFNDNE